MQIKELSLENLKTFVEPQKLRLAPFTLLYGENSSGKTTLIKVFDILNSIFNHGLKDYITDETGRVGLSDIKKNLNANRIHHYSSYNNNKDIKIGFLIEIPTPAGYLDKKCYQTKDSFYETAIEKKRKDKQDFFDDYYIEGYKTKKLKTLVCTFEVLIELKYFKNNIKPHESGTKLNTIQIKHGLNTLLTLKRINKKYSYLKNKTEAGYINEKKRKQFLKRYFEERDFFCTQYGYGDYKIQIKEDSPILNEISKKYKIFNEKNLNSKKFEKIKSILSIFKKYFFYELKENRKSTFESLQSKKQVVFDFISKIILLDEIKNSGFNQLGNANVLDHEKIFKLSENTIKELNLNLANKILQNKKRKDLILLSMALSNMDASEIYTVDLFLSKNKKVKEKNFLKTLAKSFKDTHMRFTRQFFVSEYPKFVNKINRPIYSSYEKDFFEKNKMIFYHPYHTYNTLFEFLSLILSYINSESFSGNKTWDTKKKMSEMLVIRSPFGLINNIILEFSRYLRNIRPCSPSNTEAEFSTFTKQDFKKFEQITLAGKDTRIDKAEYLSKDKMDNIELKKKEAFIKENIIKNILLEKAKEHMSKENREYESSGFFERHRTPDAIGSKGENFDDVLIANKEIRSRLNEILKRYFQIEIKVINIKYLGKFKKKDRIAIKSLMRKDLEYFNIKDKFIMIKDLKFKRSFDIHGLEIGKGPKNILPFLTQLLNERPNLIYPIQELENNWHPKYHSTLIKLLIDLITKSKNKSFVMETHSELFILQIQKLIQKGIIKPEFVSINYISRNKDGKSTINNMPINSQGGFTKPWPGGFFNERMEILNS